MALIALEGMRFFAFHGFYEEEQLTGNYYVVDVHITADTAAAADTDDLFKTINYETVYLVCQTEMRKSARLLETLTVNIIEGLKYQFKQLEEVKVRITKENPPLGGLVARALVEEHESYVIQCARCGRPMICYNNEDCWCRETVVHPKTQEMLKAQFKGCLCKKCLTQFAG